MSELIKREDAIKATWQEPSYTDPLNVLTEVRDRINALPTIPAPRWHRVEEPPKYSGKVFVWMEREGDFFDKEYIADVAYYNNLAGGRIPKGTFFKPIPGKMEYEILDNVTHWMPIEPPEEDNNG